MENDEQMNTETSRYKENTNNETIKINLEVPFPSKREAEIAHGTLSVDAEPKRGGVKRTMVVCDKLLRVSFIAREARMARVSVNSFFDHLNLVIQTMEQFGPPVIEESDKG